MARSLPVENLLPQNVGSIIEYRKLSINTASISMTSIISVELFVTVANCGSIIPGPNFGYHGENWCPQWI